ncbi:hypothetical protein [Mesobacillus campisalis]|uniref:hypothetical protein n=1 Tax=Mesobacillus campisalis TaxID=1408103 RepID=UPI000A84C9C5|nr:hypothetical protein [Mesobacillus campisalis]
MLKKILRMVKQFSGSHSDRHRGRGHKPFRSSSSGKRGYNKYGGSHRYKRRKYSSS